MHLYFYAPNSHRSTLRQAIGDIKTVLDQPDIWLSTNTDAEEVHVSAEVMASTKEQSTPLIEHMDALVIEGTYSDPEIGFLLAHAIAMKKPTLYFYRRGTVPQIFRHLQQRELPSCIRVTAYQDAAVTKLVQEFLSGLAGTKFHPVPRIKFTLRITDAIEQYLHYKTHNTKATKADYLRSVIEKLMDDDDEWKNYLRRRRPSSEE